MKKDSSYFAGHEPHLLYIAKRLKDALRLEEILTAADVDFGVETDEYYGGVVFRRLRTGAFFYVRPDLQPRAEEVMKANNYTPARP